MRPSLHQLLAFLAVLTGLGASAQAQSPAHPAILARLDDGLARVGPDGTLARVYTVPTGANIYGEPIPAHGYGGLYVDEAAGLWALERYSDWNELEVSTTPPAWVMGDLAGRVTIRARDRRCVNEPGCIEMFRYWSPTTGVFVTETQRPMGETMQASVLLYGPSTTRRAWVPFTIGFSRVGPGASVAWATPSGIGVLEWSSVLRARPSAGALLPGAVRTERVVAAGDTVFYAEDIAPERTLRSDQLVAASMTSGRRVVLDGPSTSTIYGLGRAAATPQGTLVLPRCAARPATIPVCEVVEASGTTLRVVSTGWDDLLDVSDDGRFALVSGTDHTAVHGLVVLDIASGEAVWRLPRLVRDGRFVRA